MKKEKCDWLMRPASEVNGTDFFFLGKMVFRYKTTALMFLQNYTVF